MINKFEMSVIRISKKTHNKIKKLASEKNLKQITVLEYLLSGKLSINLIN